MNPSSSYYDSKIVEMDQTLPSASDVVLVRYIAGGDELAFDELYRRYHIRVYNFVLRLIHEPKDAEDLLQEIFMAVWRGAFRFREQAQVKTWLYRIAHYQSVSWLRKHRSVTPIDDVKDIKSEGPEVISSNTWQNEDVRKALNCLSIKHRVVLELAFVHDMPYKEIAQVVGCPVGTVKSRMSYALKALNGKLQERE